MRPFRRLSGVLALLVVLLLANLSWIQVLDADGIRQREGNTRLLLEQYNKLRGPILVESAPIASSSHVAGENVYLRSYVDGPKYAAVTGYYSLLYGASGIERVENGVLSGNDPRLFVDRVQQLFAGRRQAGGAVNLTIAAAAQDAAFSSLRDARGAIVAMNARTGAVLALASLPSFDPQALAPNDPSRVRAAYERLTHDDAQPLLNRAITSTYSISVGTQFVTAAAALASGRFISTSMLPGPAKYTVPGSDAVVTTADGKPCSASGRVSLGAALATGCNTALAWLANAVGGDDITNAAQQLGFGASLSIPLQVTPSTAPTTNSTATRVSVMQLTMLAATLANGGSTMRPYLVRDVRGPDLAVLERTTPTQLGSPLSTQAAAKLSFGLRTTSERLCGDCESVDDVHAIVSGNAAGPVAVLAFTGELAVAVLVEPSDLKRSPASIAKRAAMSVLHVLQQRP